MKNSDQIRCMKGTCCKLYVLAILFFYSSVSIGQNLSLSCPDDLEICLTTNSTCTSTLTLNQPTATTDCTLGMDLPFTYSSPSLGMDSIPIQGTTIDDIPIGSYPITLTARDSCGITSGCTYFLSVIDCHAPTPICINGLSVQLELTPPDTDADGDGDNDLAALTVWASDFIASPISDCSEPIHYTINRAIDMPDINGNSIVLTEDDPETLIVRIYAWDSAFNPYSIQPDGTVGGPNYDFCESFFIINLPLLIIDTTFISGYIFTKDSIPLANIPVALGGAQSANTLTDSMGYYSFEIGEGLDYTITPFYDEGHMNGVDILDLFQLRNCIIFPESCSPYQFIAGDMNMSNGASTFDLVLLSRLVLGLEQDFPTTSWRFVDADYVFPNPQIPFAGPFPEVININDADSTMQANFIGIKMGDIDCSASPNVSDFNLGLLTGTVFNDSMEDCLQGTEEQGLEGWVIQLEGATETYFGNTEESGFYAIIAPPGNYIATAFPPYPIWTPCANSIPIQIDSLGSHHLSFPVQPTFNMPIMEVDIATPILRLCESAFYVVNYCNLGNTTGEDAYIEVEVDPLLTVTGSSLPWASVDGNTYTFDLGDVAPGACDYFHLNVDVTCDLNLFGYTHCTSAQIFPDTIPILPSAWDGSSLEVDGFCLEDSVQFTVRNTGSDMQDSTKYIVIEDDLIMYSGMLKLETDAEKTLTYDANGRTKRIIVHQADGHPGHSRPSTAIEGCGVNMSGGISLGFINQFGGDEGDPFTSIDCTDNVASYDPNDKQGFPRGTGESGQIEKNTALEYLIRFQNTGTSFANTVLIRDTIDTSVLDLSSIRAGSSSHDYSFFISENGTINFLFEDIMLLDSTTNEPESHGFVKFKINQKPDLPIGTIIENSAGIYFDFNEPVITNYTLHTIGELTEPIANNTESAQLSYETRVFPNPTQSDILIHASQFLEQGQFSLFSVDGKMLKTEAFTGSQASIQMDGLPDGIYIYQVREQGKLIGLGKLVRQRK